MDSFITGQEVLGEHPGSLHSAAQRRRLAANRERYAALLCRTTHRWGARLHAYCWLPDSGVLLLQVGRAPLECVMHSLRSAFASYLHREAHWQGRVYRGRYHARLLASEEFFLDFVRHIYWNPVRLQLCSRPLAYDYSSVRAWICEPAPALLAESSVRSALALRGVTTRTRLERFLHERPTPGFLSLLRSGERDARSIGAGPASMRAGRQLSAAQVQRLPAAVLEWSAHQLSIALQIATSERRSRQRTLTRALATWVAARAGLASLSDMSRAFECRKSTLHAAVQRYVQSQPKLFSQRTMRAFERELSAELTILAP